MSFADRFYKVLFHTILVVLCILTLYPFLYILAISLNDGKDALRGGIFLFPRQFTFDNYVKAFSHPLIYNSFVISVSRTAIVTACSVFLTALLAYPLTIPGLPGKRFFLFFFYLTSLFSGGLVPTFILYRTIKILNTFWVLVLPSLFSVWNALVMRAFFQSVPQSLPESARVDGASEFTIFLRIVMPLSLSVIATISLFNGVGTWNDWFTGAFFIQGKPDLKPAATLLNQLLSEATFESAGHQTGSSISMVNEQLMQNKLQNVTPDSLRMAFIIIIVVPILLVYPFLQKYFVKGAMLGSLKE